MRRSCVGSWRRHRRPLVSQQHRQSSSSPFVASYGLWIDNQEVVSLSPPATCREWVRGACALHWLDRLLNVSIDPMYKLPFQTGGSNRPPIDP